MDILELLNRHGYVALFIALTLEEMGIPMPIPTDVLIIITGYLMRSGVFDPLTAFAIMQVAANIGACVLYWVMRRGGRPLIERYGRYVHFNEAMLARSERLINRLGWWGIVVGRAIFGIRYATVIACGLFRVPFWRFFTAQVVGTSINMLFFLSLGWYFGPAVVEYFHAPQISLQLIALIVFAIGLPTLTFWLYRRSGGVSAPIQALPSRRRALAADVLVGFVGAVEVALIWSAVTVLTSELTGERSLSAGTALSSWLEGRGVHLLAAYTLVYVLMVGICILMSVLYHELPLEQRLPHHGRVAVLAVAGQTLAALALVLLLVGPSPLLARWWSDNLLATVAAIVLGLLGYAVIAVYGRILAIRALPPLPRRAVGHSVEPSAAPEDEPALEAVGDER
jgi:membrane protein DedA with SNARE-associated domain